MLVVVCLLAGLVTAAPPAAAASGSGVWKAAAGQVLFGGVNGTKVPAKQNTAVLLAALPGAQSTDTSWLLQVQISGAKQAGTVELWAAGQARPRVPVGTFPKGASSFTTLVSVPSTRKLSLRLSAAARVRICAVGYFTGKSKPVAGGSKAVTPELVLDSGPEYGDATPDKGEAVGILVAGLGEVPATGVRAVWLAVQTLGAEAGTVSLSSLSGDESVGTAPVAKDKWTTSLVLAPVGDSGLVKLISFAQLKQLRLSLVGWTAGTSTTTATGGLRVPAATELTTQAAGAKGGRQLLQVDVTDQFPTNPSQILLRVTVKTAAAGKLSTGASKQTAISKQAPGVNLGKNTSATVLLGARVSQGKSYLAIPTGAKLSDVAVVGWIA
ncbi:MAG: hypothetical protein LBR20_07495 [Propionibacteriaceae bacterium]|nr:hypothetical protein [Propionibacteriaceae bacterium]